MTALRETSRNPPFATLCDVTNKKPMANKGSRDSARVLRHTDEYEFSDYAFASVGMAAISCLEYLSADFRTQAAAGKNHQPPKQCARQRDEH